MRNTGIMCMVIVPSHDPDMYRYVDMGNYFDHEGRQVLVTSREKAEQYGHLVDVPIYVRRIEGVGNDAASMNSSRILHTR